MHALGFCAPRKKRRKKMDGRAGWVVNERDSDVMDEEVDLD